jgi:hypothetical protein
MQEILNKRQSTDGYKNGRFGNHLRQWDNPDAAQAECGLYSGTQFGLRWRGKGSGGVMQPCNGILDLKNWWAHYVLVPGKDPKDFYVSERCPDAKLTFQGEIVEFPHTGYAIHYSTEKTIQRFALAMPTAKYHSGPFARLMCKSFMDEASYENLIELMDRYPLHVVEFSCFSCRLGNLRRNTIFWEVRKF